MCASMIRTLGWRSRVFTSDVSALVLRWALMRSEEIIRKVLVLGASVALMPRGFAW
jgi:hypothetical protein